MVFRSLRRRVRGTPQDTLAPIIKPHDPVIIQRLTPEGEAAALAQEWLPAAARHQAFYLAFGALRERAEPTEIVVALGLHAQDLDLMVCHSGLRLLTHPL